MSLRGKRLSVCCAFLVAAMLCKTSALAVQPTRCCPERGKKIAITFDDGPHPSYTPEILEILSAYGVKATFFVIGSNAEKYPDIVKQEIRDGHEIGNHTYSHPHLTGLTGEQLKKEIAKADEVLSSVCHYRTSLFRPPEGVYNQNVGKAIASFGYQPILWTVDTKDWSVPPLSLVEKRVIQGVSDGSIILFHDYVVGNSVTPSALKYIIPKLRSEGYEFVTVSELISPK